MESKVRDTPCVFPLSQDRKKVSDTLSEDLVVGVLLFASFQAIAPLLRVFWKQNRVGQPSDIFAPVLCYDCAKRIQLIVPDTQTVECNEFDCFFELCGDSRVWWQC